MLRYVLIFAAILTILLYVVILRKTRRRSDWYFSEHIATSYETIRISRFLLIGIAITLFCWFFGWYAYVQDVSLFTIVIFIVSEILLIGFSVVPFRGKSKKLHNYLAFSFAFTLPVIIVMIGLTSGLLIFSVSVAILQILLLCLSFLKSMSRWTLYLQTAYVGLYGLVLLIATIMI